MCVEGVARVQGVSSWLATARTGLGLRFAVRRVGQIVGEVVGDLRRTRLVDDDLDRDLVAELVGQGLLDVGDATWSRACPW